MKNLRDHAICGPNVQVCELTPRFGTERYLVNVTFSNRIERTTEHATFDEAIESARCALAKGSVVVEHEVYAQGCDDGGQRVNGGAWERIAAWAVDGDGEVVAVEVAL
jgi:hypothetical protein